MILDTKLRTLRHETEDLRETRANFSARAAKLTSDIMSTWRQTCLNDLAVEPSHASAQTDSILRITAEELTTEEASRPALSSSASKPWAPST